MNGRRTIDLAALTAGLFLALTVIGPAQNDVPSGLASPPVPIPPAPAAPPRPTSLSPVIWAENPDVVQRFAVNNGMVELMVDSALLKLTSAPDIGTAWTRLGITPQDVVGIKITTMGGQLLSTHRPIIQAICDGLQAAGVSPEHIIIWDKSAADMRSAGYTPVDATPTQVGIEALFPGVGYDPDVTYKNEIIGTLIWGDSEFVTHDDDLFQAANNAVKHRGFDDDNTTSSSSDDDDVLSTKTSGPQSSNLSHYAEPITACTKIINVPVLTDNPSIGIEGCLGSLALGSVDNNRRFQGDPTYGDPAICEILDKDFIRRKVVVHILDALIAQYAGGPRFDPQFTRSIGAIYVSRDPVAIDSIVLKRLEQWRSEDKDGRIDPIGKMASHVHSATYYNLGTDDPHRIQLVRVP